MMARVFSVTHFCPPLGPGADPSCTATHLAQGAGSLRPMQTSLRLLLAGISVAAALLTSGCFAHRDRGDIVSMTTSVIGFDVSQNPSDAVPHLRLGYVRNTFHMVPTAKGSNAISAPPLNTSLSLDARFSHQTVDEDFQTGAAALQQPAQETTARAAVTRRNATPTLSATNRVANVNTNTPTK